MKSKTLGPLLFYQRSINEIREEKQQISKTSHIDDSTFPCFLNPEMVQAGKTRQQRKEAVLWAEYLSSFLPTRVLFVLGQVNINVILQLKDSDYTTSLNLKKARELGHELPIC